MQKSTYHTEIYSQLHFDTVPKVPNYAAWISPCSSFQRWLTLNLYQAFGLHRHKGDIRLSHLPSRMGGQR